MNRLGIVEESFVDLYGGQLEVVSCAYLSVGFALQAVAGLDSGQLEQLAAEGVGTDYEGPCVEMTADTMGITQSVAMAFTPERARALAATLIAAADMAEGIAS